jgi:hypothetical protein
MVVYEVYVRCEGEKKELIGVLPERRNHKERVNSESIMNWSKAVFDGTVNMGNLFFVQKAI